MKALIIITIVLVGCAAPKKASKPLDLKGWSKSGCSRDQSGKILECYELINGSKNGQ